MTAAVSRLERALDDLHARARANPALQRFTVCTRILLAVGFVPTALVKVLGERFTTGVHLDSPIGFFFEAMYRTGAYWQFIGWVQLVAGALLLIPATATLGAMLFFPVILNIFVITVSLRFTGTPLVTGPMLLAATYLLCWDYHRWKAVLPGFGAAAQAVGPRGDAPLTTARKVERGAYVVGTVAGLAVLGFTRGFVPGPALFAFLGTALVAMGALAGSWMVQYRDYRRGRPAMGAS